MSILQIRDLELRLSGKPILNGLTMEFRENKVHAVVGPNGAGKSTLAQTIMGLSEYRESPGTSFSRANPSGNWTSTSGPGRASHWPGRNPPGLKGSGYGTL